MVLAIAPSLIAETRTCGQPGVNASSGLKRENIERERSDTIEVMNQRISWTPASPQLRNMACMPSCQSSMYLAPHHHLNWTGHCQDCVREIGGRDVGVLTGMSSNNPHRRRTFIPYHKTFNLILKLLYQNHKLSSSENKIFISNKKRRLSIEDIKLSSQIKKNF